MIERMRERMMHGALSMILLAALGGAFWYSGGIGNIASRLASGAQTAAVSSAPRTSLLAGEKLPVVFVHGINGSAAEWNDMKAHLKSLGWTDNLLSAQTYSCSGFLLCSNVSNAEQLAGWVTSVRAANGGKKVILMAHSMGGVSARYYLRNTLGATSDVAAVITLASMNNGLHDDSNGLSSCPDFTLTIICSQLRRTGDFITNQLWKASYAGIPAINFYSATDDTVSTGAAHIDQACNVRVTGVGHPEIIKAQGIGLIGPKLQAFLSGTPYSTLCDPEPTNPSVSERTNGIKRFLVIPVKFENSPASEQRTDLVSRFTNAHDYFLGISQGRLDMRFTIANPVTLSRDISETIFDLPVQFGGVMATVNLFAGPSNTTGTEVDKLLCNGSLPIHNIDDYQGVIFVIQEHKDTHVREYRLKNPGEVGDSKSAYALGRGKTALVQTYDCQTEDVKAPTPKGLVYLYTGAYEDGANLERTIVHEIGHALEFGHARSEDFFTGISEYGNGWDLMGSMDFGIHPGSSYKSLTDWFVSTLRPITTKVNGVVLNTVESGEYPMGIELSSANGDKIVLERHGASSNTNVEAKFPQTSELLVVRRGSGFSGWGSISENSTIMTRYIEEGKCTAIDLGNRTAFVRYNSGPSVSVRFSDETGTGSFACGLDYEVTDISFSSAPQVGVQTQVRVTIENSGDVAVSGNYTVQYVASGQILNSEQTTSIAPGKKRIVTLPWTWTPNTAGKVQIRAVVSAKDDYNIDNDRLENEIFVKPAPGAPIPTPPVKHAITLSFPDTKKGVVAVSIAGQNDSGSRTEFCDEGTTGTCRYVVESGSTVGLGVSPDDHYAFTGFSGDYCTSGKSCSFTAAGGGNINVHLIPTSQITIAKDGSGADTGDVTLEYQEPGKAEKSYCSTDCIGKTFTVIAGSAVKAFAVPAQNESQFFSWTGCTQTAESKEICQANAPTVGQTATIKATFKKLITFTFDPSGAEVGTVSYTRTEPGQSASTVTLNANEIYSQKHPEGTTIRVAYTAPADTASSRARFSTWGSVAQDLGCVNTSSSCTMTLGTDDVGTSFRIKYQYKIAVGKSDTKGKVELTATDPTQSGLTCASGCEGSTYVSGWYWEGTDLKIEAIPNGGYEFGSWALDCSGAGETCYKNNITGPATIKVAAFPVHEYTFYIQRDCSSAGNALFSSRYGPAYCGQGDITAYFGTGATLVSPWTDYLTQRYRSNVSGSWEVDGDPGSDSWTDYWECWVNEPYDCRLEGNGVDTNGDGFITVSIWKGDVKSSFNRVDHFGIIYGFRSDYDLSFDVPKSSRTFAQADEKASPLRLRPEGVQEEVLPASEGELVVIDAATLERMTAGHRSTLPTLASLLTRVQTHFTITPPQAFTTPTPNATFTIPKTDSPAWLTRVQERVSQMFTTYAMTLRNSLTNIQGRALAALYMALPGVPDLVAHSLSVNDCSEDCVLSPNDPVSIRAFITNQSFTATTGAFGARVTIRKTDAAAGVYVEEVYRYDWDGIDAQAASPFFWPHAWVPKTTGTYDITLTVDDWNNLDTNTDPTNIEKEALTITVTVSDAPVVLTAGVREGFGGTVTVSGGGLPPTNCTTANCLVSPIQGSRITLQATPDTNREFIGWEGTRKNDCVIYNYATSTCEVLMNSAKLIKALFETKGPILTLTKEGAGLGSVSSTNTGGARNFNTCTATCEKPFVAGSNVVLTATANAGSYFSQWGGVDAERCTLTNEGRTCTLKIKANEGSDIRPLFELGTVPQQTITVRTFGAGTGAVEVRDPQNSDALIGKCTEASCEYTVNVPAAAGKALKVIPVPNGGSQFDKFVSPTMDLTDEGKLQDDCPFSDNTNRLRDENADTWVTCGANDRISFVANGKIRVTGVSANIPSAASAVYTRSIKKAIASYFDLPENTTLISFNAGNMENTIDAILEKEDIASNQSWNIASINTAITFKGKTASKVGEIRLEVDHTPSTNPVTVSGKLKLVIDYTNPNNRKTEYISFDLPGPAYTNAELGNVLVQQYVSGAYSTKATLTRGSGLVSATFGGIDADGLSFIGSDNRPMRIGELTLTGSFRNPCSSSASGVCTVTVPRATPTVVPVTFVTGALGDVILDGKILASDALAALKLAVGQTVTGANMIAADANCDGSVKASDALMILRAAVGSITLTSCSAVQAATQIVGDITIENAGDSGSIQATGLEQVGSEYRITLSATGNTTSRFIGWAGNCTGTTCVLTTEGTKPLDAFALFAPTTYTPLPRTGASLKLIPDGSTIITTPPPTTLLGDVNNSGTITASDALAILKYAVGQPITGVTAANADVLGCDGRVLASDALYILKVAVGTYPKPTKCVASASVANLTTSVTDYTGAVSTTNYGHIAVSSLAGTATTPTATFTAVPETGKIFEGWSGACTGKSTCTVNLPDGANLTLKAMFSSEAILTGSGDTGTFEDPTTPTEPPPIEPPPVTPPTSSGADLVVIGGRDLRVTPVKAYPNRAVNVIAKIRNQGAAAFLSNARVSLRIDQGNDGTWDFATAESLQSMKTLQIRTMRFAKAYTPTAEGSYSYQVCVNDGPIVPEQILTENIPAFIAAGGETDSTNNCQTGSFTVLPPVTRTSAAAGALGTLVLLVGVPMGVYYLSRSRERMVTML